MSEAGLEVRASIGGGETAVSTGLPVLDHLLELLARYGGFGLRLEVEDEVEPRHFREANEEPVEHREPGLDLRISATADVDPDARSSLLGQASTRSICAPTARSRSSIRS